MVHAQEEIGICVTISDRLPTALSSLGDREVLGENRWAPHLQLLESSTPCWYSNTTGITSLVLRLATRN
ncbi:hypothetical protein F444_13621 [Phytophthora nicotianae P1976]|uniref:Uncharacterized protein n=1 Tax=Phytophthora nicotianae P1976 TaxID=1317066 RepID=A0A080ZT99_PHYNI|nr:hypothetical protein F444_13621 [Phytophthora nicotianae P1976]